MRIAETYNPDATRRNLLNAAFMEIYIKGFQSAGLSGILANVDCTKGALYHHFPNKKALGLSVVDEIIAGRMHEVFMLPLEATDDPIPVLSNILKKKAATITPEEVKYGCPLNNLTQEMAPIDKDFNARLRRISDRWVQTISDALGRGIAHANVKTGLNSKEAALFIVASIEGAFGLAKTAESKAIFSSCIRQLNLYIKSLKVT